MRGTFAGAAQGNGAQPSDTNATPPAEAPTARVAQTLSVEELAVYEEY